VIQELYGLLIAHYAVRVVMHDAALQAEVDPDRLSFAHAVRVLQDASRVSDGGAGQVPLLYRRVFARHRSAPGAGAMPAQQSACGQAQDVEVPAETAGA